MVGAMPALAEVSRFTDEQIISAAQEELRALQLQSLCAAASHHAAISSYGRFRPPIAGVEESAAP